MMICFSSPCRKTFKRKANICWDIAIHSKQLAHNRCCGFQFSTKALLFKILQNVALILERSLQSENLGCSSGAMPKDGNVGHGALGMGAGSREQRGGTSPLHPARTAPVPHLPHVSHLPTLTSFLN